MQVPDFASVIFCALGKLKVVEKNENDVSGIIYYSLLTLRLNNGILQMNAYPVEKMSVCSVLFVSLPAVIPLMNCGILTGQEETLTI